MFSSDCFRVLGLLSFFPLPCTVCLDLFLLKILTTLPLKLSAMFYRLRNITN